MDGDQIVVEVQETVFVSDVVDSDITVHNFVPDDPDSVVIQDVIEDVVIEDVQCPDIMEEPDVSETVIIPEQVLDTDVAEEVSLAHCTVPDDVLASDITAEAMSIPEHVLTSESMHVPEVGHVEHVVHDNVEEADIVTDTLGTDVVSEEVLVADCASEAVIDANGIPVEHQDEKGNCEDYLMISCKCLGKAIKILMIWAWVVLETSEGGLTGVPNTDFLFYLLKCRSQKCTQMGIFLRTRTS